MILYKFSYCSSDDDLTDSVVSEFARVLRMTGQNHLYSLNF